jgi:ketosteroid isomerase-like protein
MESEDRADFVNPREPKTLDDTDKTLATPNFDEKSIHRARPAVPLAPPAARASRPLPLVALAVAAGLVGGLVAILALTFYERRAPAPAPADAEATQSHEQQTAPAQAARPDAANAAASTQTAPAQTTTTARTDTPAPIPDAAALRNERGADGNSATGARGDGAAAADGRSAPAASQPQRGASEDEARELRAALSEWVTATNARDIDGQMKFYGPRVASYYLSRNASREAVRAEKQHVFARASAVDVRAGDPEINIDPDGQSATMRFRKDYQIAGDGLDKRGAVIQELRWRRTPQGWRITSERDLRVVP